MSTLSVPLPPELEKFVAHMVSDGYAANKAEVVRLALKRLAEEEALQAVLRAQNEPNLKGDLRGLMKRIK